MPPPTVRGSGCRSRRAAVSRAWSSPTSIPNGSAADVGFNTGDVILDVAGKSVSKPADVRKALADARADGKRNVLMRVKSERGTRFVAIPLARG